MDYPALLRTHRGEGPLEESRRRTRRLRRVAGEEALLRLQRRRRRTRTQQGVPGRARRGRGRRRRGSGTVGSRAAARQREAARLGDASPARAAHQLLRNPRRGRRHERAGLRRADHRAGADDRRGPLVDRQPGHGGRRPPRATRRRWHHLGRFQREPVLDAARAHTTQAPGWPCVIHARPLPSAPPHPHRSKDRTMTTPNNRRTEPGRGGDTAILGLVLVAVAVLAGLWVAVAWGSVLSGVNPQLPASPVNIVLGLLEGSASWPPTGTLIMVGEVLAGCAVGAFIVWLRTGPGVAATRLDHAARYMARARDLRGMTGVRARKEARRLGVVDTAAPGIPVGVPVGANPKAEKALVYASFEQMMFVLAGPRMGKTTCTVVPALLAAPGAVLTTSNKRDVVDDTRRVRAAMAATGRCTYCPDEGRCETCSASAVWVFDPQQVADEPAAWWWNPLSFVTGEATAATLAQLFADGAGHGTVSGEDGFFPSKGRHLLAGLLLAAATANLSLNAVHAWAMNATDQEPAELLRKSYPRVAASIRSTMNLVPETRDGVYASTQGYVSCLENPSVLSWVTPGTPGRGEFDPDVFVRGHGTLYSLSMEGAGTAGPLVAALTAATVDAAERFAKQSPGGRLATPLVVVLDEVANVCRWRELPSLYSHYGSRGIPIMAVFQSWAQGQDVFGRDGIKKLWSAANVKLYLGNDAEPDFLGDLSTLIGSYDRETTSVSFNKGVRSTSLSLKRDRILEPDELSALPRGRAVMLSTGNRAALLQTTPWHKNTTLTRLITTANAAAAQEVEVPA
ncbi:conjugal transfer protein [Rathayibacter rathayi]|nr:conjugal transfer protein [Rathayibacter rathayi]PPG75135.1 conjugal transfer protein [Rathayibacter rathayi]PPI68056.1 conjugal transfer protein [Rathayibacter rathayi]